MAINIQSKTDYSLLFNSLGTTRSGGGSSGGNLNFLSDYASIKNGSYGKLMKAYYGEAGKSKEVSDIANKKTASASKDDAETLGKMQTATDELKESADALLENGNKSVFKEENAEKIYNAVKSFVDDYNSVLDVSDVTNSTAILNKVKRMVVTTAGYEKSLAEVGITVAKDSSLVIDKETFLAADMDKVKNLFNKSGSFGYASSAQASLINYAANNEASKANTYNVSGSYTNNYSSGSIFDSIF